MNLLYRHSLTFVVIRQQFSNIFSVENNWTINAKFHVEPPKECRAEVDINSPGHITKTAAVPIYGIKNL